MVAADHRAVGGRANGLYHVVCHSCAVDPTAYDDTDAPTSHETLTADRVFATMVYGEHDDRGCNVESLRVE